MHGVPSRRFRSVKPGTRDDGELPPLFLDDDAGSPGVFRSTRVTRSRSLTGLQLELAARAFDGDAAPLDQ